MIYFEKKDGKVIDFHRIIAHLDTVKDGKHVLETRKYSAKRSNEQNRLYQAYAKILAHELGYEFEEMKDILRFKFLKREKVDERSGEVLEFIEHTSKLSMPEFVEFTQNIQRWAAEMFDVVLEDPETQINFKI